MYKVMLFFLTLNFFLINCQENDKLIFAMIHFRHGARAPITSGMNDDNIDGFGEKWDKPEVLTGIGERMHYLLGYRNRIRYIKEKKLLSEKYNPDELVVITTRVNRTIMSVSSHLQGLYPQNKNLGYILNEKQLKNSNPPIDLSYEEIQEEIKELQNNALPHNMTVIPFETRYLSSFVYSYAYINCIGAVKIFNRSLSKNSQSLLKEFNDNYQKRIDEFNGATPHNYTLTELFSLCDNFIATYTDGRDMIEFKIKTEINTDEFYGFCKKVIRNFFYDYFIKGKDTIYLEGSQIMGLLINYTKQSIDADINNNPEKAPKILIYSGHDITVTKQELFVLQSFGYNLDDNYKFPTYASQIAFEITRKDDDNKNRKYSDYFVNYYFNDELILNITADEFINKTEVNIWPDEKINAFCASTADNNKSNDKNSNSTNKTDENNNNSDKNNNNSDENNNNSGGNSTVENNDNSFDNNNLNPTYFSSKKDKSYKTPFIVMISLFGVSLIANIILLSLLVRKNINNNYNLQIASTQNSMKI